MAQAGFGMHPGRVLREEYMEPAALDAERLATALRVPPSRIVAVIDDEGPITSDLALRLASGDYIQLVWHADNTAVKLETIAAGAAPVTPVSPSVIVSVVQV